MKTPSKHFNATMHSSGERGFTIIELIVSISILTLLITTFATSLAGIFSLEKAYTKETSAIILVGNAMQRMAAAKQSGPAPLLAQCETELQKNILLKPAETTITTTNHNGISHMVVRTRSGTPLIEIEL